MKTKVTVVLDKAAYDLLGAAAQKAKADQGDKQDRSASGLVDRLIGKHLPWPTSADDFPLPGPAASSRTSVKAAKPSKVVKTTLYLPVLTVRLLDLHSVLKAKDRGAIIQELVMTRLQRCRVQTYKPSDGLDVATDRAKPTTEVRRSGTSSE
jgi:hypothetical protein